MTEQPLSPRLSPDEPPASPANALRTALLAASLVLVPALLACLFVLLFHTISPPAKPPAETAFASLTNRLSDGSATNLQQLTTLHKDLRVAGVDTEEVNLRLWASLANEPLALLRLAPPKEGKTWTWHLSQNGLHALAVSQERDPLERRSVALYDLTREEWLWTCDLPWPDTHEQPYVFDGHLVLRYSKNGLRFAMELDSKGKILSIDALGKGAFSIARPPRPDPFFPGTPVASMKGLYFTASADGSLSAYPLETLPGLRYAGKGNDSTLFSGNGMLKFVAQDGRVSVYDSLTQTRLQQLDAWPHSTNTAVTGLLTTRDGSDLTVFLKTRFPGTPPVARDWNVTLSIYSGAAVKCLSADTLFAKPKSTPSLRTVSPDGLWALSVNSGNDLSVCEAKSKREIARIPLAKRCIQAPLSLIAFLEEGRHVVLRQNDNFWLLDFSLARRYGDLLARNASSTNALPSASGSMTNTLFAGAEDDPEFAVSADPDALAYLMGGQGDTVPSYVAMRAELFAANQAWHHAAALLEQTRRLQEYDGRAPRVNPLLLARCQILSGQRQPSRQTCLDALRVLINDPSPDNRMARYHLQGLLFAKP